MPNDVRYRRSFGTRLRFLLRLLGCTGLFAAGVGAALYSSEEMSWTIGTLTDAGHNKLGQMALIASSLMAFGALSVVLMLLVELLAGLGKATGRRSFVGINAGLQIVLAIGILGAVNVYSFTYPKRWDLTKDQQFTLPDQVVEELKKLQGETQIVVLQQHKTFGQLASKPDASDYAAERKVVEKVRDLVDQFQSVGPQFKVSVLDVEEEGYDQKFEALTKDRPALKEAIKSAPENSIFFAAEGKVQRLSFNEFYQLDKSASKSANDHKGNLVLRPQGLAPFTSRITSIQERKPRVGLAVIHQVLTSREGEGFDEAYSSAGLRKCLESYGFEVTDIILKKWGEGPPQPGAYNYDETELERLEGELEIAETEVREILEEQGELKELKKIFEMPNLEDVKSALVKKFGARVRGELSEKGRKENLASFTETLDAYGKRLEEKKQERDKKLQEVNALLGRERAFEDRRVSDVKTKFARMIADCDLLILPRMTIMNPASDSAGIPARIYNLSKEQIEVIKDFMKAGKPVLALMGPLNGPNNQPPSEPDDFEKLLVDRGVELGRQTILFDADSKAFASRMTGEQFGNKPLEIPMVTFKSGKKKNPLAEAMRITGQSVDQALDIRLRAPRPIYILPGYEDQQNFSAEFLYTSADSWNEEKPIAGAMQQNGRMMFYRPRYEATKFNDPKKDTHDEERRGPFPIGVAIESKIPVEWVDSSYWQGKAISGLLGGADQGIMAAGLTAAASQLKRPTERLVVIGQGGVFVKPELGPAKEKFLLHTCNWLLGREDRLPQTDEKTWEYPRVQLTDKQKNLWYLGTFFGLPALFAYFGIIVWLIRNVR